MVDWSLGPPEICDKCDNIKVLIKINNKWETKCKECLYNSNIFCIKFLESYLL